MNIVDYMVENHTLKRKKQINFIHLILIIFSTLLLLSIAFITITWTINSRETEEEMQLAIAIQSSIQKSALSKLKCDISDIDKDEYNEIKNNLMKLVNGKNNINFAYIYVKKDDKILFLVDSEPLTSKYYSEPGKEYLDANDDTLRPFNDGQILITKPHKDFKGTWISILVPMKNILTDETIAVFGIDYPAAENWSDKVVISTIHGSIVFLLLILTIIIFYFTFRQNKQLKNEKEKLIELDSKLKESELLFRTIFDQAPIGIAIGQNYKYSIFNNTNRPSINPMFEKIIGRTNEELMRISWMDITHPDDVAKDLEYFEKFKNGEINGYDMEKRYIRPDGTYAWVHMFIAPLWFNNDNELNHLCLIEDISKRKNMEKDLLDSERSKAVLLDNLSGMAYRCNYDSNWSMQFISQGCFELTGYKTISLLNNKEISYNDLILPQYRQQIWDKWSDHLSEKSKFKDEYEIQTATGEVKWVYEQGQGVYDENGSVIALEGLIIDITDRKLHEMEIKFLNEHDYMTGLFNRRYFEDKMKLLDHVNVCLPLSIAIGNLNGVRLINDAFGREQGDIIIKDTAKIIKDSCYESHIVARTGGDEFSILMPNTNRQDCMDIIQKINEACELYNKRNKTKPYSINISFGYSIKLTEDESILHAYKDADDYMYKRKLLEQKSSHGAIMTSIMATMFAKSQDTEEHAERLSKLCKMIGIQLGLQEESLDLLELFTILHDVGKIGIDDSILNKPERLNDEEWSVMKKHPEIGYRIAMSSSELKPIADYILTHHERWDGKGYPQGLKGDDIPLLSRILNVVDAYDAMTKDRVYRNAMVKDEAISEIKNNSGTQFDPLVVNAFIKVIYEYDYKED